MRILVTGAAGFVGRHLVRELEQHGHLVIPSDIGDADLAQPGEATRLIETSAPEYVVHLAARYGRLLCADEPHRSVSDNAAATTELAEVCASAGLPVLYTSSSEVYGDHGENTITEESPLHQATTIYGMSKLWGEEALRLYLHPERLCIVRMNMLYGPEQQAGYGRCALATFIANALAGEPITVHRDASRSWLYISDAVRALRMLVEQGQRGVYNLGNGTETTQMYDLARIVVESVGRDVPVEVVDAPATQIRHKNYDGSKLRAATGWSPQVTLREGIAQTVAAYSMEPV